MWRKRYLDSSIQDLHDELRHGRPRTYDDGKVAQVVNRATQDKSANTTNWSTGSMGASEGISASTFPHRSSLFGVKTHLTKALELSTNPFCIERVRDITELYPKPPDHSIVLCVDEKSQSRPSTRTSR